METLAYIAAALIGILLGAIGGGGSILTIPVLVYLFGLNPVLSTSYSLFVVGTTSLVGAFNSYKKGFVQTKTVLLFGMPSVITVFAIRKYIMPLIPASLPVPGGFTVATNTVTMLLFGLLMVIAALRMVTTSAINKPSRSQKNHTALKLSLAGIGIGIITGFLGAGGGFLLIPVLILLVQLTMKQAVGTSLSIVALNSIIGFVGDLGHFAINWTVLLTITATAVTGIFIGGGISEKVDNESLKKGFGYFILLTGVFIIIIELLPNAQLLYTS